METGTVITITSLKGGVGKSTVAANLAHALAARGNKVLAVDCDFNMRSLDLIFGVENQVVYDLFDVLTRNIPLKKAIINDERRAGLDFCPAPYSIDGDVPEKEFCELIRSCVSDDAESSGRKNNGEKEQPPHYDYVIIDTPGDTKVTLSRVAAVTDIGIIVTTHQPAAVRAAERTGYYLGELGVAQRKLIINAFDSEAVVRGIHPGIIETIDNTGMQLLGVIPYDSEMLSLQEKGMLVAEGGNSIGCRNCTRAFTNIAGRLSGENLQLFDGFKRLEKNITLI